VLDSLLDARLAVQGETTQDSRGCGEALEVNRGCGANAKYNNFWLWRRSVDEKLLI